VTPPARPLCLLFLADALLGCATPFELPDVVAAAADAERPRSWWSAINRSAASVALSAVTYTHACGP
jgi:hypothetical protein